MVRKLSPLDKEKRKILVINEGAAVQALTAHRKICAECHPEANWPRRACDDGWLLAKKAMRAVNDLSTFLGTIPAGELDGQIPLW